MTRGVANGSTFAATMVLDPDVSKAIVNKGKQLKAQKLENKHIYRHPNGSQFERNMSSIFPGASGNTGMGAFSKVARKRSPL